MMKMRRSSVLLQTISSFGRTILIACALAFSAAPASSEKIASPVAVFAGLDKITARITAFEVAIDGAVQFGALRVTPRVCYLRPPTEPPLTSAFVEVDEVLIDKSIKRIFTGWMFAHNPGLHAVEHPVFDVWLTSCRTSAPEIPAPAAPAAAPPAAPPRR